MLSINRAGSVCPRCSPCSLLSIRQQTSHTALSRLPPRPPLYARLKTTRRTASNVNHWRPLSTSRTLRQDASAAAAKQTAQDIETVVRDTKQRFRDTLPTGYLNEEEYALYVRLYGPPLRETTPDDVGIPAHVGAERGDSLPPPKAANRGTVLRELEDGEFEEIAYTKPPPIDAEGEGAIEDEPPVAEAGSIEELTATMSKASLDYVNAVARNQREHDALSKLLRDFEASQKKKRELELAAAKAEADEAAEEDRAREARELERLQAYEDDPEHDAGWRDEEDEEFTGPSWRIHPLTVAGKFSTGSAQVLLPRNELVEPLRQLLSRSHLRHVKAAAEEAFGGKGLPLSPASSTKTLGHMGAVGLPPDQKAFSEIEADAFLAAYIPPAYASVAATLHEVRRRLGHEWIQSRLREGGAGLSVLDAGAGGAGLVAWQEILEAEWALVKEKGGGVGAQKKPPPGRRTVVAASDRLRHRLKTFLQDTTFLPRLPDYEHSGEMQGEHLDAGRVPQPRKSYDLIIASHLFLKEEVAHHRQAVLNNLWSLLNKDGGVLVVIEKAHPRGFEAVAHVRDTILRQFLHPQAGRDDNPGDDDSRQRESSGEDADPAYEREREAGHVVAPCTTQGACPMYRQSGKSQGRKDYCHFQQRYFRPGFHSSMFEEAGGSRSRSRSQNQNQNQGSVEFSYVAVQRGRATRHGSSAGRERAHTEAAFAGHGHAAAAAAEGPGGAPAMQSLPRLILPPLKRKGHVTLDVCTPAGEIERWTVPKSFGKQAYHDARKARWGDLWALGAKTRTVRRVRLGKGVKPGDKARRSETKRGRRGGEEEEEEDDDGDDGDEEEEHRMLQRAERKRAKKRDKRLGLIQEILEAETIAEEALEAEMDLEDEMEKRSARMTRPDDEPR